MEVYPAAALIRWGLVGSGYKGSDKAPLAALMTAVSEAVPLELSSGDRQTCASVHDAFDGLERLVDDPHRFRFLDAAQLIKHYLGLKHRFPDRRITFAYLYWQPSNALDIAPCMIHAAELAEFTRRLADPRLRFVGMAYSQLWEDWTSSGAATWLAKHVAALRRRYELAL